MAEKKQDAMNYIQTSLKAPKNQRNTFGNYNYRSCEDILEAVKPLLAQTSSILTVSDDIVQVADRIYVKATATLTTPDGKTYSTQAFAREPLSKKGQDDSQVTGAASSYARKYALNGLFAIDDNKDADVTNTGDTTNTGDNKDADTLRDALEMIKPNIISAPSKQYLDDLHARNPMLHKYEPYRNLMNKRAKELKQ